MALLVGDVLHVKHLGLNQRGPLLPHVLNDLVDVKIRSDHLKQSARIRAVQTTDQVRNSSRAKPHLVLQEVPSVIDDTQDSRPPAAGAAITAQHSWGNWR